MVDFSDKQDVEQWLMQIVPTAKRRKVAIAMAARAALRVLPLVASVSNRESSDRLETILLPVLRATSVACGRS